MSLTRPFVLKAKAEAYKDCVKILLGEIEIYEEEAAKSSKARVRRMRGKWRKLKEIVNRIQARAAEVK